MVQRSTKFTVFCIAIYVTYALFVFFFLPYLVQDPVALQRDFIKHRTHRMGNLTNLTMEEGGKPIRSILVTFKGSGAMSLLQMLSNYPGAYNHYAPLLWQQNTIRDPRKASIALGYLQQLLSCDYTHAHRMLRFGIQVPSFMQFYGHQKKLCSVYPPQICWDPMLITRICRLHPFINMSVYLLRLHYVALLLNDERLNVRIVLLVRDPRGTMQSRRHRVWCAGNPDCEDPKLVCEDLVSDYKTAEQLLKKFPSRFRTLRYEDLSLNPYDTTQEILQFYGLPFDPAVEEFLDTHTKVNIGGVSSTYRDSRSAPFHWKQDLRIEEIKQIQNVCGEAMDLWGYRKIENFTHFQNTFDPIVLPPPFT